MSFAMVMCGPTNNCCQSPSARFRGCRKRWWNDISAGIPPAMNKVCWSGCATKSGATLPGTSRERAPAPAAGFRAALLSVLVTVRDQPRRKTHPPETFLQSHRECNLAPNRRLPTPPSSTQPVPPHTSFLDDPLSSIHPPHQLQSFLTDGLRSRAREAVSGEAR